MIKKTKVTAFWDIAPCSPVAVNQRFGGVYCLHNQVALMMEAVNTSERSVNLYGTTRRNIPEGCHLHSRCRENLKSHISRTIYKITKIVYGKYS
jgi:hypothetical protein